MARTCHACRGVGKVIKSPCTDCRGAGRVEREKQMEGRFRLALKLVRVCEFRAKASRVLAAVPPVIFTW